MKTNKIIEVRKLSFMFWWNFKADFNFLQIFTVTYSLFYFSQIFLRTLKTLNAKTKLSLIEIVNFDKS